MREERVDVCVVGSGAGGSVVAYRAAQSGRSTLLVEMGPYLRPEAMNHYEFDMLPWLYKDGALQMNASLDLFIMQGVCVGGSTTLSNMVMFPTPAEVLTEWRALGASTQADALQQSYDEIAALIETQPVNPRNVSPGTHLFRRGAEALGHQPVWMDKALGNCLGCGNCNIGCAFGSKKSALTTFVPWAEAAGARVLADTEATHIRHRNGRVSSLEVRVGRMREPVRIVAKVFVIAAGVVASSALLLKSHIRKNVGTRVSFNAGAMVTGEFDEIVDGFDSDQMTTYLHGDGYTVEATHNPLLTTSLTTPGWMSEHANLMRRFRHMAYAGVLIPTQPVGRVVMSPWFGHEETLFRMPADDLAHLKRGLRDVALAYRAAGARRVYMPGPNYHPIDSDADLDRFAAGIHSARQLQIGSAHPQGGNPMSDDPEVGAVNSDLRVHGFDNLFVADASVFPTSVRLNPVGSIMALVNEAAPRILAAA